MKLIVLRDNLIKGLYAVERAITENANLPILKNFLMEAKDKITLASTNLELGIKHVTTGKIIEKGEAAIPFSVFKNIVSNLNSEKITIELKDKNVIIGSDNYEATIKGQSAKEFPIIPSPQKDIPSLKIGGGLLVEIISKIVLASQYSDIRPEISGIFISFRDGALFFVATDSFRLAEKRLEASAFQAEDEKINSIIPLKTANEVIRLFTGGEEDVSIFIEANQIVFKTPNQFIVSRLIDGSFPDYLPIIPKHAQTEIVADRKELMGAVKLVSSFSGRASDIYLRGGGSKKFLELFSSDGAIGENKYRIPIKTRGEEFSVAFNWRYLFDGLKIHDGEDIVLGINAPDKPVTLKNSTDKSLVYVVMPIKS